MAVFDISKCMLGDPVHDAEHVQLFTMMDNIIDDVRHNCLTEDAIQTIVQRLRLHFEQECAFMEHANYPHAKEHKRDHESLLDMLDKTIKQVRIGGSLAYSTLVLENVFADHIKSYDTELHNFVHSK